MTGSDPAGGSVAAAVVEDDARYRESLLLLLRHASGFTAAAAYGRATDAICDLERLVEDGRPWGLVLMDLDLPGMKGIEATRRIKEISPGTLIVILTVFEEPGTILEAICAGADGYLLKKVGPQELVDQLRVVAAGGAPLTAGVARSVLNLLRHSEAQAPQSAPWLSSTLRLTGRERDVLRGLVRGLAYKQVAVELDISLDTVRHHVRGVYGKLQVHSVAEAVSRAIRERLV